MSCDCETCECKTRTKNVHVAQPASDSRHCIVCMREIKRVGLKTYKHVSSLFEQQEEGGS
jgi:hypothetical protein